MVGKGRGLVLLVCIGHEAGCHMTLDQGGLT